MRLVKQGTKVRVSYTGRFANGIIFDASDSCEGFSGSSGPLEFIIGDGTVIPGFDAAVRGMSLGENKTVIISEQEAYGPRFSELIAEVSRDVVPPGMIPEPGQHLEIVQEDGTTIPVVVVSISDHAITLDANHPLAGRDLTFDIRLDALHQ